MIVSPSLSFSRDVLPGITSYAYNVGNWEVVPLMAPLVERKGLKLDGVVGMFTTEAEVEMARRLTGKCINFSNNPPDLGIPKVVSDDPAVGRLAANYLLSRGFKEFGYYGIPGHNYSIERLQGFAETIRRLAPAAGLSERYHTKGIREWIRGLPKPVAIFACNDIRASNLVNLAAEEGQRVPAEVSVLGVDNDEIVCALARVPLSSIILSSRKIGFEAAKCLDRWVRLNEKPPAVTRIAPAGINTRTSTDSIAVGDPIVAAALQYLRENAYRDLLVTEIADQCGVGRRTLERKFKESLQSSPHDEIQRLRLDRARKLLVETDLSIDEVAANAGFTTARILSSTFRKVLRTTPSAYKKQMQLV